MKKEMSMMKQLAAISMELFGEDCTNKKEAVAYNQKQPVCEQKKENPNKVKKYMITYTGEDYCDTYVEMTVGEAAIVDRVLKDANSQVKGYCGRVYLDMKGIPVKVPTVRRITSSELLDLTFGSKIKVIWHNSKRHEKNEEYVGVIFGQKIGWEDGLEDDVRTIAECVNNDWCMVYLMKDQEECMLVERIWDKKGAYGVVLSEYKGWFLFGLIPLYIKEIKRR